MPPALKLHLPGRPPLLFSGAPLLSRRLHSSRATNFPITSTGPQAPHVFPPACLSPLRPLLGQHQRTRPLLTRRQSTRTLHWFSRVLPLASSSRSGKRTRVSSSLRRFAPQAQLCLRSVRGCGLHTVRRSAPPTALLDARLAKPAESDQQRSAHCTRAASMRTGRVPLQTPRRSSYTKVSPF